MDVAAEAARRFLVTRQLLAPARSVEGGPDGVLEIFRRLGSIQFDPLSVAGRNDDLVLHARVAGYDPAWCDALYERRELFEATTRVSHPHERLPMVPGEPAARGAARATALRRIPATVRSVGLGPGPPGILVRLRLRVGALRPAGQRRWGWYVLPILFRDRLVGRIEPRIDRSEGSVRVLNLWWEDSFDPRRVEGFLDAMQAALRAYLHLASAGRLEWGPHLRMERRLFLTRP
jgi:uncharacterized protein YcaQ